MLPRMIENGPVRLLEGVAQSIAGIAARIGQVNVAHRVDRDAAGDLSTPVPAHAVGHDEQAALALKIFVAVRLEVTVVIFVDLAFAAGVGEISQVYAGADLHV